MEVDSAREGMLRKAVSEDTGKTEEKSLNSTRAVATLSMATKGGRMEGAEPLQAAGARCRLCYRIHWFV